MANYLASDRTLDSDDVLGLPKRDQPILIAFCVLAFLVLARAAPAIVDANLFFFGEYPTERQEALGDRSYMVMLWAATTPVWVWTLLRGRVEALVVALLWVFLFLFCEPWWWPPAPSDALDAEKVPVWYGLGSIFPWTLVAAALGMALLAALRSGQQALFLGTVIIAIAVVVVGGWSYLNLGEHARAERLVATPEARAEFNALTADPLWAALPAAPRQNEIEDTRYTDHDGVEYPTMKMMHIGTTGDFALFRQVISVAQSTGWTLHGSLCGVELTEATFTKELAVGTASLRVAVASYDPGISIHATVRSPATIPQPVLCWQ